MIVSNRNYMFGTGYVEARRFRCVVSTAPEGLFKGCSVLIQTFAGQWGAQRDQKVVAKAILHPTMSKSQRAQIHKSVLSNLDALGNEGLSLGQAIERVFSTGKKNGTIVEFLYQAS